MSNDNGGGGGFFAGLVIGAIVGGVAAVLLTQEDVRDQVVGKAREAGNAAMDATGDLRGTINDVASQWQQGAADLAERGRQVVENARANVGAAMNDGFAAADSLRDELQHQHPSTES